MLINAAILISVTSTAILVPIGIGTARAQNKPVPPLGIDPGGAAIGLLTTGIDYRLPSVAACLARDGEGRVIAWDVVDRDPLPYRQRTVGTMDDSVLVSSIDCNGRVRLVPVRIDPSDPISFSRSIAFLAMTPARVVLIPESNNPTEWAPMIAAAKAFPHLLIVVAPATPLPSDHPGRAIANIAISGANVVTTAASMQALADAAAFAACASVEAKVSGAALKSEFEALSARRPLTSHVRPPALC